jgi:hypothetical protein
MTDAARHFDVLGAFPDQSRARRAVDDLTRRGLTRANVKLVPPRSNDPVRVSEMEAEMQQEVSGGVVGPGVAMTTTQAKGAGLGVVGGAVVGLVAGLLLGAVWAFMLESAIPPMGRLAIVGISFMVAGAVIGFVGGGALAPRIDAAGHPGKMLDEKRLAGENDTLVAVHVADERQAEVARRVLESSGATRIDDIGGDGSPRSNG